MDRREFLFGAGVLFATSPLPVCGDDVQGLTFSTRGKFERFSASYTRIHIGLEKPFSLLHVSDTHLSFTYADESERKRRISEIRTKCFGGMQEMALRDTLAWARENCDFVLHTGDLIDFQSRANYDLAKKYLGEGFVTGCLGNHEFSPEMWMSEIKEERNEEYKGNFREELSVVYPFDLSFHSRIVNGVNFVMMDDVYGYVTRNQVRQFMAEVAKGLPIILCMHVPIMTEDIIRCSLKFWANPQKYQQMEPLSVKSLSGDAAIQQNDPTTRDFIAYLKSERLLRGILSGHLHIAVEERFSPTAVQYVAPGNYLFAAREVLFD